MKRNLLFSVDDTIKRDILNIKEVSKKVSEKKEVNTVKQVKSSKGKKDTQEQKNNRVRQTVRALVDEFKKKHPDVLSNWPSNYIIVDTEELMDKLCTSLAQCNRFAYDTETTGLEIWLGDRIVGMSFYTPVDKLSWYIPLNHVEILEPVKQLPIEIVKEKLKPVIDEKRIKSHKYTRARYDKLSDVWWIKDGQIIEEPTGAVTFNGKFDNHVMWINMGIEMPDIVHEGYLAIRVLNENEPSNKMKHLCNKWLNKYREDKGGTPVDAFDEIFEKTSCQYFPIWMVGYYACKDTELTWEWMEFSEHHILKREGLSETFYTVQIPVLPPTIEAERIGVEIDIEMCKELEVEFEQYLVEIENTAKVQLQELMDEFLEANPQINSVRIPTTSKKREDTILSRYELKENFVKNMNINSSTQLCTLFYDIWQWTYGKKEGKSTNEKVMKRLARKYVACRTIVDYRVVKKQLSTYVLGLQKVISPIDGRVHTSFNPFGARTGRFSSSEPNLQNIPAQPKRLIMQGKEVKIDFGKKLRRIFKADDGTKYCSTDYSQIEPRILAVLCMDPVMLEAYKTGKDIYSTMAQVFFPGHPEHEYYDNDATGFKSPWRNKTKAVLLGLNYGMTEIGLAGALECTEDEAVRERNRFFSTFSAIGKYIEDTIANLKKTEFVETLYQTKCRIPDINDNRKWIRAHAERQSVNSIIQGSSADITKRAMALVYNNPRLKELGVKLLLTVHDEVITQIPDDYIPEAVPIIKDMMSEAGIRLIELGGITIKVDAEVSQRWYGELYKWGEEDVHKEDNDEIHVMEDEEEFDEVEEVEESVFA